MTPPDSSVLVPLQKSPNDTRPVPEKVRLSSVRNCTSILLNV